MIPWSLRLRSWISSILHPERKEKWGDAASETIELGRLKANSVLEKMHNNLLKESFIDPDLASFAASKDGKVLLSFELQYLWGFFHEHASNYDLPTNVFDRIQIHLMDWLTTYKGYTFEDARLEAAYMDRLYNEADPLFESISKAGKKAYTEPDPMYLVNSMRVLMEQLEQS